MNSTLALIAASFKFYSAFFRLPYALDKLGEYRVLDCARTRRQSNCRRGRRRRAASRRYANELRRFLWQIVKQARELKKCGG